MVAINIKMPKNCVECKLFHFYIDTNGVIHFICKYGNMEMCGDLKNKRDDLCPLIEADNLVEYGYQYLAKENNESEVKE